jgi:hypothetical protein
VFVETNSLTGFDTQNVQALFVYKLTLALHWAAGLMCVATLTLYYCIVLYNVTLRTEHYFHLFDALMSLVVIQLFTEFSMVHCK